MDSGASESVADSPYEHGKTKRFLDDYLQGFGEARLNPLLAPTAANLPIKGRQRLALEQLAATVAPTSALGKALAEKLPFYKAEAITLPATANASGPISGFEAAEFILRTFTTPGLDQSLRQAAVDYLRTAPKNLSESIVAARALMPVTRGARIASNGEVKAANEALVALSERFQTGYPPRTAKTGGERDPLQHLYEDEIADIKTLDTDDWHVSSTWLVTFKNGKKAVFKPITGEYGADDPGRNPTWIGFTREVNAYDIIEERLGNAKARADGTSHVVLTPVIETVLQFGGKSLGVGSLQGFLDGYITLKKYKETYPDSWSYVNSLPDMARARTLSNILGNYDAFPNSRNDRGNLGNIMVKVNIAGGKPLVTDIALIDNAVGRNAEGATFPVSDAPDPAHIPADLRNAIRAFDIDDFDVSYRLGGRMDGAGIRDTEARIAQHQARLGSN